MGDAPQLVAPVSCPVVERAVGSVVDRVVDRLPEVITPLGVGRVVDHLGVPRVASHQVVEPTRGTQHQSTPPSRAINATVSRLPTTP